MRMTRFAALLVLMGGALVGGRLVRAADFPLVEHVDGYPKDFHKSDDASYAVYHKKETGWHLVVTAAGHRHHFKGKIWIEGDAKFGKVEEWKGDGERKLEGAESSWLHKAIKRGANDREISFDFVEEHGHEAGIDFNVEGTGILKWDLGIGGAKESDEVDHRATRIKIGQDGKSPPEATFSTRAHPEVLKDLPLVVHVDGYPNDFYKGDEASYAVFHTDNGWHLIVTSAGHRHHFKGKVWIEGEGKFAKVEQWKGEGERKAENAEANWFYKKIKRSANDREITFDIVEESKQEAGINFTVDGPGGLKWELGIGGPQETDPVELKPDRIKIGRESKSPSADPFATFAHPDERGKGH